MRKPKLISGYRNTKLDNEDLAITPYLFLVWTKLEIISIYGLGFCWWNHSIYIGFGYGIPKTFPFFRIHKK